MENNLGWIILNTKFNLFLLIIKSVSNLAPAHTSALVSLPNCFCSAFLSISLPQNESSSVCFEWSYSIFLLVALFIASKHLFKIHTLYHHFFQRSFKMHTAILVEYDVLSLSTFIHTHTKTIKMCLKFNLFFYCTGLPDCSRRPWQIRSTKQQARKIICKSNK